MSNRIVIESPIYIKIILYFFIAFGTYGLLFSTIKLGPAKVLLVVYVIYFMIFIPLTLSLHTKYNIDKKTIIKKTLLFKPKYYEIDNIIGFSYITVKMETNLTIYFINDKIKIDITVKKSRESAKEFIDKHYKIIYDKNVEEIKNNGFTVYINKNYKIIFYSDNFEVYKENHEKYYYDKDIKDVKYIKFNNVESIDIRTRDNFIIKLNTNNSYGGIGLFDFLMKSIKTNMTF